MEKSMKLRNILPLAGLAFCLTAAMAQNSAQDELPSAPSATQQKPQPAPPTPAAPVTPAPESSAPAKPEVPAPPTAQPADAAKTTSSEASKTAQDDDDSVATIRRTVNEVNVMFTVTDKHGRYVKDLKKEDFKIIDGGKPAAEIRSFHA